MFGYITVSRPELRIKDDAVYRAFYCGLCRSLKRRHGLSGQTTLSYDMTFLALLLSGLYEPETKEGVTYCLAHPAERHATMSNEMVDYAADMNLLLAYYKRLDDWTDEKKLFARLGADALKGKAEKVKAAYPRQAAAIAEALAELAALEADGRPDLDAPAGATGRMLSEIFVKDENDVWAPHLRQIGFYLGKFIYLMDGFEDLEKDEKKGNYNPWRGTGETRLDIAPRVQEALTMMMSEATLAFERLPILLYEDILRNILYAGVWTAFDAVVEKDREALAKKQEKDEEAPAAGALREEAETQEAGETGGKEDGRS